jgi:hypothetical protein
MRCLCSWRRQNPRKLRKHLWDYLKSIIYPVKKLPVIFTATGAHVVHTNKTPNVITIPIAPEVRIIAIE